MYEIWLGMNILWEIARDAGWFLAVGACVWLVTLVVAWRKPGARAGRGMTASAAIGVIAAILAFLTMPWLNRSSLGEVGYWVDWLALSGMAAGAGLACAVMVWPLVSTLRSRG